MAGGKDYWAAARHLAEAMALPEEARQHPAAGGPFPEAAARFLVAEAQRRVEATLHQEAVKQSQAEAMRHRREERLLQPEDAMFEKLRSWTKRKTR